MGFFVFWKENRQWPNRNCRRRREIREGYVYMANQEQVERKSTLDAFALELFLSSQEQHKEMEWTNICSHHFSLEQVH